MAPIIIPRLIRADIAMRPAASRKLTMTMATPYAADHAPFTPQMAAHTAMITGAMITPRRAMSREILTSGAGPSTGRVIAFALAAARLSAVLWLMAAPAGGAWRR